MFLFRESVIDLLLMVWMGFYFTKHNIIIIYI